VVLVTNVRKRANEVPYQYMRQTSSANESSGGWGVEKPVLGDT